MQVAVFEQEASSGSLGAQEALEVTMTSDASFMTMMFSNLYSNQVLASVREPICNAWDAMIDANKADQLIDITFDRETGDLSIRDYGKGIPKDKIAKIYGVFGGSTKRTDSKTTGGFGLGSKAPWALVESFRVTSRNNGNMSVYNMAKATLESEGKPMIIPMVDIACPPEDSGLTVQFRVPEANIMQVMDYIQYIVLMGGIKARWNGTEMQTIDLSTEPGSYTTDESWFNFRMYSASERIFIRYGTVVYPILRVPGTEKAIELLSEFMEILNIRRVLIQAAPNTLGLTPARESLSSGLLTENGLTKLCVDLIAKIEKEITGDLPKNLANIEQSLMDNFMDRTFKGSPRDILDKANFLNSLPKIQRHYYQSKLATAYRDKWDPRLELADHVGWKKVTKAAYPKHFDMLNKLRHDNKHAWIKFGIKAPEFNHKLYGSMEEMFFDKLWFQPMLKKLHRAGINLNDVGFYNGTSYGDELIELKGKKGWRSHHIHREVNVHNISVLLEALSCNHISFYSGSHKRDLFRRNPALISNTMPCKHSFAFKIKADQDITEIVAKLEKMGIAHTDLRKQHDWDPEVIKAKEKAEKARLALEKARETRRRKAEERKALGLTEPAKPRIKNALGTLRSFLGKTQADMGTLKPEFTTDAPKFFLEIGDLTNDYITTMWKTKWLTEEEKDSIVVVRNGTETRMAQKRGATDAKAYFAAKLFAVVSERGYKKYFTKQRRKSLSDHHKLESSLFRDLEAFGIPVKGLDKLTHNEFYEEISYLYFHSYRGVYKVTNPAKELEEFTALRNLKLDIPLVQKLKNVAEDPMLNGIIYYAKSGHSLRDVLKEYPERKQALKQIILAAFNRKDLKDA